MRAGAYWLAVVGWTILLNGMKGYWPAPSTWPSELLIAVFGAGSGVGVHSLIRWGMAGGQWRLGATLVLSTLIATLVFVGFLHLMAMLEPVKMAHQQAYTVRQFLWEMFYFAGCFGLWSAIALIDETKRQSRAKERRLAEALIATQEAEIRALHYQINPHFLFNTLNAAATLILDRRLDEAERTILSLAAFFRRTLSIDPMIDVPLSQEIEIQRLYLEIERVRFADDLQVSFQVPHELMDALVPSLILQPLVENAVKHGIHGSSRLTRITIAAFVEGPCLVLQVRDDGPGQSDAQGAGVGLVNVRRRLQARFLDDAGLTAGPNPKGGYVASLRLPMLVGDPPRQSAAILRTLVATT